MGMALLQVCFAIARALDLVSFQATNNIAAALGMTALLIAVPLAYLRYRSGDSASIFMLLGWVAYATGGVALVLWMYGMIDAIPWRQTRAADRLDAGNGALDGAPRSACPGNATSG